MQKAAKAAVRYLPLAAVAGIAGVYAYAWSLFRPFDSGWLGTLTAVDIFSLGWSLTPGFAAGILFGFWSTNLPKTERQGGSSPVRKGTIWWRVIRGVTGFCLAGTFALTFGFPFVGQLPSLWARIFMLAVVVFFLAFAQASMALLNQPQQNFVRYNQTSWIVFAFAGLLAIQAMGAVAKQSQPTDLVELEDGRRQCALVVFSGQNSIYLYDRERKASIRVERRLVRAVAKPGNCAEAIKSGWFSRATATASAAVK